MNCDQIFYTLHIKSLTLGAHFTLTLMKANFGTVRSESPILPFYNVISDIGHFTIWLINFITEILWKKKEIYQLIR